MRILLPALVCSTIAAQQQLVVPAAFAAQDAPGQLWIAGMTGDHRIQTLIAPVHLMPLVGRSITGMTYRRDAVARAFPAGAATITIRMSIAPVTIGTASPFFAANHAATPTTCFAGTVSAPMSPAPTGATSWNTEDTVVITFQNPFVYSGGTLCVDCEGLPASPATNVWTADAVQDLTAGTETSVGAGCGSYVFGDGRWAFAEEYTLVPGATAQFTAFGTPDTLAWMVVAGTAVANAMDLTPLGMPGCRLHLLDPMTTLATTFGPATQPMAVDLGARAHCNLQVPNEPWAFGASFASQWLDWGQLATSNAIQWTIAASVPGLDMTTVSAMYVTGQSPVAGRVERSMAHVFRFDYQ